ncbi:MAG TPA: S8 family serine peptidase, partial [Pyrinomonadaceae bacterium]|nr:S8 family serine peptidase [Pyrinomonadaceae bacterium]
MSKSPVRLFAALLLAAVAASASVLWRGGASAAPAPVSVIVELKDDPAAVYKAKSESAGRSVSAEALQAYRASLSARQDSLLDALRAGGVSFEPEAVSVPDFSGQTAATVPFRFTLVYNGVTLKVPADAVAQIESLPAVKAVHFNGVKRVALDKSVRYINAPKAYGKIPELTAFDDFREGHEGQGINIAVLDTGIDWTHPMFGGDPTPPRLGVAPPNANTNRKVIYYMTTSAGLLDDFGHGSHASADAAGYLGLAPGADGLPGTADDVRVHGVAPQAKLMGYKVCAASGDCVDASTILAVEDAVSPVSLTLQPKPVAHVINLSLGGAGGPDDATSAACDNAVLMGAVVVASAGNDGPGEGTVGSPAAGRRVIAVGANTDPGSGVNTADLLDGGRTGMKAIALEGSAPINSDLVNNYVYVGQAETPDAVPDSVQGRIALIQRGSSVETPELPTVGSLGTGLFATKTANVQAKGAVAAVFVNNVDGELSAATVYAATIPVLGMSKENGDYLKSLVNSTVGAVSTKRLRINDELVFSADMADFSSRGPVLGYGQIKPDVTAPGVDVLAATSLVGAPAVSMQDATRYIGANGTSFSGPHVAGAAALIKQAHLDWNADQVRTALINTATNLRDAAGTPKPDGPAADSVIAQGGGLVDVHHAINAKALMGVAGDGLTTPSILGSHSFGEVPVVNSRTTHTESVTVTLQDNSGQERTYTLAVAGNRDLRDGLGASVAQQTVTVPANGSATFKVNAVIDGDRIRSLPEPIQMQWYVTARSADGESLRMPFYLKPVMGVPANHVASVETYAGRVAAGDGALQLASGTTYVDVPFDVSEDAFRVDARLDFPQVVAGLFHDLDFLLLGPDGAEVGSSAQSGGPEFINANVTRGGRYTYRVVGFANLQTDFTITSKQIVGGESAPATLGAIQSEFRDAQGRQVDLDGAFTLYWGANGSERGFEVERSADGGATWQTAASAPAGSSLLTLSNQPDGALQYRLRSLYPGQIGTYVSDPGNSQSVFVDRRTLVDISSAVETVMSNVSFAGGVFQLDLSMTNKAAESYLPYAELRIVRVNSASGTVTAANADNRGAGTPTSPAAYNYSATLGADQAFTPGETSAARTMRFNDPKAELFTFDVQVTAYKRASGAAGGGGAPA